MGKNFVDSESIAGVVLVALCVLIISLGFASPADARSSSMKSGTEGTASWYSRAECMTPRNPNALTASGEPLDDQALTCAHRTYAFGTILRVTHIRNGKSIEVRVNDRGPAARLGRIIDLTKRGFESLEPLKSGLCKVRVEVVR